MLRPILGVTLGGNVAVPVGIDNDGNGIWEDTVTGERFNAGEPLTGEEIHDLGLWKSMERQSRNG